MRPYYTINFITPSTLNFSECPTQQNIQHSTFNLQFQFQFQFQLE